MRNFDLRMLVLITIFMSASCSKDIRDKTLDTDPVPVVHSAHLSDGWYPQNATALSNELNEYFAVAKKYFDTQTDPRLIRGLIVPHAGWYYSGLCASSAYQTLLLPDGSKNDKFERVIIIAPSHRVFVNGVALPKFNIYKTALGEIKIDTLAIRRLSKTKYFTPTDDVFEQEHAIEIQLPFLQHVLTNFKIVPLIVGNLTDENFSFVIEHLQKFVDEKTLIVVSSDFTHHGQSYDYKPFTHDVFVQIRYLDSVATNIISSFYVPEFDKFLKDTGVTICGFNPIRILMGLASVNALGPLNSRLACYYTSAQLALARKEASLDIKKLFEVPQDKDMDSSVSYIGAIFTNQKMSDLKEQEQLTVFEKNALLCLARDKIENEFKPEDRKLPDHVLYPVVTPAQQKVCGAFVTLSTKQGNLRGCIGRIISDRPLFQVVADMAVAAAFQDDRFSRVTKEELNNLVIDITVLTPPVKISGYQDIVIGRDGIVLKKMSADKRVIASAVFLPQVPRDYRWNLQTTLENLSQKAGIGKDGWKENCEFEVFQGYEIRED